MNTRKVAVGYHGTVLKNLEQGLDSNSKIYDKSNVPEVAIPEALDITNNMKHSIVLAYRLGWEVSDYDSLRGMDEAILLFGRRVNATSMEVKQIWGFLMPEWSYLAGWPLDYILEECTRDFFE